MFNFVKKYLAAIGVAGVLSTATLAPVPVAVYATAAVVAVELATAESAEAKPNCGEKSDPCSQQVKAAYQAKLASLDRQPQLPTTLGNCKKVDVWSFKVMPTCRAVTAACKGKFGTGSIGKMSGWCAKQCAECQRKRNFILGWEDFCLSSGYKPVATRRRQ